MPYHKNIDFVVQEGDNITEDILTNITINRTEANKPVIILVTGKSGEGKSYSTIKWIGIILKKLGIPFATYFDKIIVFTPIEYGTKTKAMLFSKDMPKALNVMMIDEAREVIDAKKWQSFINQAIAHINAMSRGIKPLIVFIVSQSINDIDKSLRRTLTYYCKCVRPLHKPVRMQIYRLYEDDGDVENIKLKKSKLVGRIRSPKGASYLLYPEFIFKEGDKEILTKYEEMQREAKGKIINAKIEQLIKSIESEYKDSFKKVDVIAEWYSQRPEQLNLIIKTTKGGKIKVLPELKKMHDLTDSEVEEFQKRLKIKLNEKGVIRDAELQGKNDEYIGDGTGEGNT